MKVQYSKSTVKQRFLPTTTTSKNSGRLYKDIKAPRASNPTTIDIEDLLELMAMAGEMNVSIVVKNQSSKLHFQYDSDLKSFKVIDRSEHIFLGSSGLRYTPSYTFPNETAKQPKVSRKKSQEQKVKSDYLEEILSHNMQIGDSIQRMRVLNNLNSQSFAKALGISPKKLHKYENGTSTVSKKVLAKIGEIIGIKIKDWNLSVIIDDKATTGKKIFHEMMTHYLDLKKAQKALEKLEG